MIQFRCDNILSFDAATGQYVHCEQVLAARDDQAGEKIRCKRCQQWATVPESAQGADELEPLPATQDAAEMQHGPPTASEAPTHRPLPIESGAKAREASPRPLHRDIMQMEFEEGGTPVVRSGVVVQCRHCGTQSTGRVRCQQCGHPLIGFDTSLWSPDQPTRPAGMQLWLLQRLRDPRSATLLVAMCHVFVGVGAVAAFIIGLVIGGPAGITITVIAMAALMLYAIGAFQTRHMLRQRPPRLRFWQRWGWNAILRYARKMNWQRYDASLAGRKIIDLRGRAIGDDDLVDLQDLDFCQVLDLEGTQVSDVGLMILQRHKNLRCLVVRDTQVTPEGVFRLQQSIPHLWIWY